MPYCPKCDMEFIDGITTCTDCGGRLVESEEAYKKEMQKKMEQAYQQRAAQAQKFYQAGELMQREVPLSQAEEGARRPQPQFAIPTMTLDFGAPAPAEEPILTPAQIIKEAASKKAMKKMTPPKSFTKEELKEMRAAAADKYAQVLRREEAQRLLGTYSKAPARPAAAPISSGQTLGGGITPNRGMAPNEVPTAVSEDSEQSAQTQQQARSREPKVSNVYVSTSQKIEDRRSSSVAFLLVGGIILAFAAACWAGIIRLPMTGGSLYFAQGILTAMGLGFLVIAAKSRSSIKELDGQAEAEEARNKELIQWFTSNWTGADLDKAILSMESGLEQQELELRRYALIQYRVVKEKQLTSQSYVDFIVEEIYNALYPED